MEVSDKILYMTANLPPTLTLTRPDDWHVHVRDGLMLTTVVPHTAERFGRAVIMPNLRPPVTTTQAATDYAARIMAAVPDGVQFVPLMTLYLTAHTPPDEVRRAQAAGIVAAKFYPAGATTHSDAGISDWRQITPTLAAMQKAGMPLLIHGEVTAVDVDIFDREAVFIDTELAPLRRAFPALPIVLEHITTRQAVQYVQEADWFLAATITAHHLLYNRNALFAGGLRPHCYCLPVLKRESHRLALLQAATGGCARFFFGSDSAPHLAKQKESDCACAGCYTANVAIEMLAQVFESANALHKLEAFASWNGADFYGLERNTDTLTLQRAPWTVPDHLPCGPDHIRPLCAGQTLDWRVHRPLDEPLAQTPSGLCCAKV